MVKNGYLLPSSLVQGDVILANCSRQEHCHTDMTQPARPDCGKVLALLASDYLSQSPTVQIPEQEDG